MPYITQDRRDALTTTPAPKADTPKNAGELNYVITKIIHQYWVEHGRKYKAANDIAGACANAAAEFYRRVVARYEDTKIHENGDVLP